MNNNRNILQQSASLLYQQVSVIYKNGELIPPNYPSITGFVTQHFSISPPLPSGLFLDESTGVISGIPDSIVTPAIYTITLDGNAGSVSARLQIEVREMDQYPETINYIFPEPEYLMGVEIEMNLPITTGGAITKYTIIPELPTGLDIHPVTGAIFGIPSEEIVSMDYLITGSNSAGALKTKISLAVTSVVEPPRIIKYWDAHPVYVLGQPIYPSNLLHPYSGRGGIITQFTVSPPLPEGLSLNSRTGVITGTPVHEQSATVYTVTGGNNAGSVSTQLSIQITSDNKWLPVTGMNIPRYMCVATELTNGQVLVTGGSMTTGNLPGLSSAELYDPVMNNWRSVPDMKVGRFGHSATILSDGRVLIAGGGGSKSAELFDSTIGTWVAVPDMNEARTAHQATLLLDGRVLITGGGGISNASTEIYDPKTNAWIRSADMINGRAFHQATLLHDGRVFVSSGDGVNHKLSEMYTPRSDAWKSTASSHVVHFQHKAALVADNKVLVIAGDNDDLFNFGGTTITELYDPEHDDWTLVGSLTIPRSHFELTPLNDDQFVVTGGDIGTTAVEMYDGTSKNWSLIASMASRRSGHSAVLLKNGNILVIGGQEVQSFAFPYARMLPSAELWVGAKH